MSDPHPKSSVSDSDGGFALEYWELIKVRGDEFVSTGAVESRNLAETAIPTSNTFCGELQRFLDSWCQKLSSIQADHSDFEV